MMYYKTKISCCLAGASAIALIAGSALAQTAPAPQSDGPGVTSIDDVVVTARRRDERLQDVPIAVSALSGENLAQSSVVRLEDVSRAVPALQITPSGFGGSVPRFTIRSQSQYEGLLTLDPSVAVYFADVVQSRAHGTNAGLFDLESVEVLKGPQGTLFGRNTTGGAILIHPARPNDRLGGYVSAIVGDYDQQSFEGVLNVPLSDKVQFRLAGRTTSHDGYTDNLTTGRALDDENNVSWRASLRFAPTDSFTNTLVVNGFSADEWGTAFHLTNAFGTALLVQPGLADFLDQYGDTRTTGTEATGKGNVVDSVGVSNVTEWNFGSVTVKNILGYREVDSHVKFDFDGSPFGIFPSDEVLDANQWSDEFQILGTAFDERLNWITGAFWFREKGSDQQIATLDFRPFFLQVSDQIGWVENESRSVFAQGSYDLTSARNLSLTVGLRYTEDDRALTNTGFNLGNCLIVGDDGAPASPCRKSVDQSFSSTTYTVGLDWQVSDDKLLYFATRKGYRAGGFNLRAALPIEYTPFNPENVTDYEIGFKGDFRPGGGALRTNIALYYQDYEDIQRTSAILVGNTLNTIILNAATATVWGGEAEVTWRPIPDLQIKAFYSYSNAEYSEWTEPVLGGGTRDLSGNGFTYAPAQTGGASVRWEHGLSGNVGGIALQADVYAQSRVEFQDINVVNGSGGGYALGNLRAEWFDLLGSRVSAAIYVRNVTDEEYYTAGTPIEALGLITKTFGAPRTVGVELRVPFGD